MASEDFSSGFFEATGNHKLYFQTWSPLNSPPRAHVFYFTGLHESLDITAVDRLSKALTEAGMPSRQSFRISMSHRSLCRPARLK